MKLLRSVKCLPLHRADSIIRFPDALLVEPYIRISGSYASGDEHFLSCVQNHIDLYLSVGHSGKGAFLTPLTQGPTFSCINRSRDGKIYSNIEYIYKF